MSSRHLIDPELLVGLEMLPPIEFSATTLPFIREQMKQMLALPIPEMPEVLFEEYRVAASEGHEIPVLVQRPRAPAAARPAVLQIHGGGYIIGSAQMGLAANLQMVLEADCVVAAVDYRLAPDTPHPGPVEDCYAALKWLHANAEALGADPNRIAVIGESAGGGLAAALALLARDRGEVALVHQHLIYPMIDDRTCTADAHPFAGEFIWTPESNRFGWSSLLGCEPGGQNVSPYAAAARAEDLAGLPSTFIAVGALDLFAEENIEFARRLMRVGVPTELHVYPGAYHGFQIAADAHVTKRANHISMTALRLALHRL